MPADGRDPIEPSQSSARHQQEKVAGVLFDATGTLIATRETVGQVYASMASEYGVALPAWRLDDAFRRVLARAEPCAIVPGEDPVRTERAWWSGLVRSTFLAADSTVEFSDFDAFFARLFDYYAGAEAWCLREGCAELLQELQARSLQLGIVSNFDHRLMGILETLVIKDFFTFIATPSRCGFPKPSRDIFESALCGLAIPASAAVYVGDDPEKDLAPAQALGMRTVDARLLASLEELPAHLDALDAC